MYTARPPWIYRVLSPKYLLCSVPCEEKKLYLTFDDGPIPEVTPRVLEILGSFGVKATFFCVGENVRKNRDVYDHVLADGHAVGNHTFNHVNGWQTSPGSYYNNVMKCREFVETSLFRPPHGRFTPQQYMILKKDFRFVLWSVLTMDYHPKVTPEACLANAVSGIEPGNILVFHDSIKAAGNVIPVLPLFIGTALEKGFAFELLSSAQPISP
jgi:peptidoglycan/xylan/chitin deacetylase (PgdA/CDA1 family)